MSVRIDTTLHLENDSERINEGRWKWSVWVEGSPDDLAAVQSVTYRLHPTFPSPVVHIATPANKFKLSTSGWGEFSISADALMKNGETVRLERWLTLQGGEDSNHEEERPSVFLSYSIGDTGLAHDLSEALKRQGLEVRTAETCAEGAGELAPQIEQYVQRSQAVVAVVSDPPSRFVEQEALNAHKHGQFVVPVLVGNAKIEGALSKISRFEVPDGSKMEGLALQIASRIKDFTTEE